MEFSIRGDARRFENWECFFAGKVGLAKAAEYAMSVGLDASYNRIRVLAEKLRADLVNVSGVEVHDLGLERCGIVTFSHEGMAASDLNQALWNRRINVTTSNSTSARWDFEDRGLSSVTRASLHYFNTEQEIARFCDEVQQLTQG